MKILSLIEINDHKKNYIKNKFKKKKFEFKKKF